MACKPVCKLCDKLVLFQSVTFAGGNLVINLPAGSYGNGCKYCIVVAQAIPATTTINAPGMTRWAAMSGAVPRASPWWTIPGTGPGCGMSLTSPTPEPARTPAHPGSGRWRNGI